jgi:MerR family transcriptional regulator/heat shock protein HspR
MTAKDKPVYMISVVAQMLDVHPQTLRLYEREGLIRPSRTGGNTRLYSQDDVERVEKVLNLTRDLGVNLAGVDIILRLQHKIEALEAERTAGVSSFIQFMEKSLSKKDSKLRDVFVQIVQAAIREGVLEAAVRGGDQENEGGRGASRA